MQQACYYISVIKIYSNLRIEGGMKLSQLTYKPLDELINRSGMKIDAIASKMGISRQRLYELRKDPLQLGIDQIETLAHCIKVDFWDIYEVRKKFKLEVDKNTTN